MKNANRPTGVIIPSEAYGRTPLPTNLSCTTSGSIATLSL